MTEHGTTPPPELAGDPPAATKPTPPLSGDDPVLEEQVQQQFVEEGKYNTDNPCYLYTF